ncbi:MAG: dihydrofolate reductase family protein [Bacteroidota bacterium]
MRKIEYYVAVSLDGYIAGLNESIELFATEGPLVDQYTQDLQEYDTVIMGRKTYEFGYKYGLPPGQPAYPHMHHYIFSNSLKFENPHERVTVMKQDLSEVQKLKEKEGSSIYLCGGGVFAGWLLENKLLDRVKLKLNPIILGRGTPLFGNSPITMKLHQTNVKEFDDGLSLRTYDVHY